MSELLAKQILINQMAIMAALYQESSCGPHIEMLKKAMDISESILDSYDKQSPLKSDLIYDFYKSGIFGA